MTDSRKLRLLAILREAGDRGALTSELLQAGIGSRYSARLFELRDDGYVIQGERVRDGEWRYRLVHEPEFAEPRPAEAAPDVPDDSALSLFEAAKEQRRSAIYGDAA